MPVFEQGYRRFDGELSGRSRVLPIAFENVRTRLKWWTWLLLAVALFVPHLIYAVMVFVFTVGQTMVGGTAPTPRGTIPITAFESRFNPDQILIFLQGDCTYLYWDTMHSAFQWGLLFPAICCAGILCSDRRTGALQIYFARPVTRRDYLVAKFLAVSAFTAAVTGVPALLLWIEAALLNPNTSYALDTWHAPFAILMATAVYCLWNGALVLFLSSILKRPILVAIGSLVILLTLIMLGIAFAEALDERSFLLVNPKYLLGGLTAPFFGLELPDWLRTPWLFIGGLGLPMLLLAWVWFRTKAIEVHT